MFIVLPEEIPQEVLKCKAVAREIIFSSAEEVRGFRYTAGLLPCSIVVLFYCAVVLLCGTALLFYTYCYNVYLTISPLNPLLTGCVQTATEGVLSGNLHRRYCTHLPYADILYFTVICCIVVYYYPAVRYLNTINLLLYTIMRYCSVSIISIHHSYYILTQCILTDTEWHFQFGFVIPGSTNTWQQTIDAAPPSEMLPAQVLSGNVVFETSFYDGEEFLCKNSVRLYYV